MKTILRIAVLLAAALMVVGAVWGLAVLQGGRGLPTGAVGPELGFDGEGLGPGGGEGLGPSGGGRFGGGVDSLQGRSEGGEHRGPGRGEGQGRGEDDQASWMGLSDLGHNLLVIGLIGAAVIALSKGLDALRRVSARRRMSTSA
jgi:hypothetical protein